MEQATECFAVDAVGAVLGMASSRLAVVAWARHRPRQRPDELQEACCWVERFGAVVATGLRQCRGRIVGQKRCRSEVGVCVVCVGRSRQDAKREVKEETGMTKILPGSVVRTLGTAMESVTSRHGAKLPREVGCGTADDVPVAEVLRLLLRLRRPHWQQPSFVRAARHVSYCR